MSKLVLFDIDGTLLLTGGAGLRALSRAFEMAFQVEDAFAGEPLAGRTDRSIITDALARAGLPPDEPRLVRFHDLYYECLRVEIEVPAEQKRLMPGVPELLEVLAARDDVFTALLTGNLREAARIKLSHFDLWSYFGCGAFGDDAADRNALVPVACQRAVAVGWPAFPPGDVLIVGDTPRDVECAVTAGARAVAVATGGYDRDALDETPADAVFDDLSDVARFLELLDRPQS